MWKKLCCTLAAGAALLCGPAWAEKGGLEITSEPGGAKIFINGQRKGSTPTQPGKGLYLELEEGEYTLEAKSDDGSTAKQTVFVPGGGVQPAHLVPAREMEFVKIPAGCFQMGSNNGDSDEKPVHQVCVKEFYLGKYEVTQGQWQQVMGSNPSHFKGANLPVENVS